MNNQEAIAILGNKIGLPGIVINDDARCDLVIEGRLQMSFVGAPQETLMDVSAPVLPVAEVHDSAAVLLELNFAGVTPGGGWFAIDKNANMVVLRAQFDFAYADEERVVAHFEGFAKSALHWSERLPRLLTSQSNGLRDLTEETLIRV